MFSNMSNSVERIIKCLVVIISFIFGVIGMFIFSLGIYIQIIFNIPGISLLGIGSYINIFFGNDYFNISVPLITVGFIFLLNVIIGCIGVIIENICFLKTAILLLALMIVAECGCFITAVVMQTDILNYIETNMDHHYRINRQVINLCEKHGMTNECLANDMRPRDTWDWIQESWECCGINSVGEEIEGIGNAPIGRRGDLTEGISNTTLDDTEELKQEIIFATFGGTEELKEGTGELKEGMSNITSGDMEDLKEGIRNGIFGYTEELLYGISNSTFEDVENTEEMVEERWNITSRTAQRTNNIFCCIGEKISSCQKHFTGCFSVLKNKFLNDAVIGGIIFTIAFLQIVIILLVGCLIKYLRRRKGFGRFCRGKGKQVWQDRPCESWKLTYSDPNQQQYRTSNMYIHPNMIIYNDPTESTYSHIFQDRKHISFKAKNMQVTEI